MSILTFPSILPTLTVNYHELNYFNKVKLLVSPTPTPTQCNPFIHKFKFNFYVNTTATKTKMGILKRLSNLNIFNYFLGNAVTQRVLGGCG